MTEFTRRNGVPRDTFEQTENDFADRKLLHGIIAKWAGEKPDHPGDYPFVTAVSRGKK